MNNASKPKEELLKELQVLQHNYDTDVIDKLKNKFSNSNYKLSTEQILNLIQFQFWPALYK
jgi:hypothetical protein